jgi:integrative and conjugative element protein (TIGR02256 family)
MSAAVVYSMQDEAERTFPLETGGVLLGYWASEYTELVISEVTGPGPQAKHETRSFVPDHEYQEAEIARIYQASGRFFTYLGDWHSHPLQEAYLSRRDRRTLRHIGEHKEARAPMPIMSVIGRGPSDWSLRMWRYMPRRIGGIITSGEIAPLEIVFYDE